MTTIASRASHLRWAARLLAVDAGLALLVGIRDAYTNQLRWAALLGAAVLGLTAFGVARLRRPVATVGWWLGGLWVVEIGINNLWAPPVEQRDRIDNIFWALIAAGILFVALRTGRQAGARAAMAAGTWAGVLSGVVACTTAATLAAAGRTLLAADPVNQREWAVQASHSGAPSIGAYFAMETMAGALLHLVVLGLGMGAILGVVGALGAVGHRRPQ